MNIKCKHGNNPMNCSEDEICKHIKALVVKACDGWITFNDDGKVIEIPPNQDDDSPDKVK